MIWEPAYRRGKIKVNGYTFTCLFTKGNDFSDFLFPRQGIPFKMGSTLKGKNLFLL